MLELKFAKITWGFILLGIEVITKPKLSLIFLVGALMLVDFITGVLKSKFSGKEITSEGYRRTIIKFLQYAVPVLILWGAGKYIPEYKDRMKEFSGYLMYFIIYIEVTSIFENLHAIDQKSPIAKYLYRPALRILKFGIENNPLVEAAKKLKEETVVEAKKEKIEKVVEVEKEFIEKVAEADKTFVENIGEADKLKVEGKGF